jgi:hypothetical protein
VSRSRTKREPRVEKSCPLPSAHTRLRAAHELWHRAVAAYPNPDEFVLQLNQLIVTMRQVTFMVQTQKGEFEDFDAWYGPWQDRFRADPIMKWLHDARTKIEHTGDLELASTARVSVVADWLNHSYSDFDVPPSHGPEMIAADIETQDLPPELKREGIVEVERRWVSNDLPDHELTELCAHGYGVLSTFLADAHAQLGFTMRTFGGETHEGRHVRTKHLGGRLPCMAVSREMRVARIHLASGRLVSVEERSIPFEPERHRESFERRREDLVVGNVELLPRSNEDPLDVGARWSSVARRVLAHDGYHQPMAFLLSQDASIFVPVGVKFDDQAEKYIAYEKVASQVNELGSDLVVLINESWHGEIPRGQPFVPARDLPHRSEGLSVTIATPDGRFRNYWTPFTRDKKNNPVLGPEEVLDQDQLVLNVLAPFRAVWARWAKNESKPGSVS